jgi:tetratricopeptide (TPR) repeat protein
VLKRDQGRSDEAITLLREAVSVLDRALGPSAPQVTKAVYNLALAYALCGKYERAHENFRRALSMAEQSFGPDHPQTGVILWDMADLLAKMKRGNEAKECRERASAIQRLQNESTRRQTVDVTELMNSKK